MTDEWDVIHAAVLRLRALAGDGNETAADVEDWKADMRLRLERILLDAGHPDQARLDRALRLAVSVRCREEGR